MKDNIPSEAVLAEEILMKHTKEIYVPFIIDNEQLPIFRNAIYAAMEEYASTRSEHPVVAVKAEELLDKHCQYWKNNLESDGLITTVNILNVKAAISEALKLNEWISVEDDLPKIPAPYYEDGVKVTPTGIFVLAVQGEDLIETYFTKSGFGHKNITHWMYKPEPPIKSSSKP